MGRIAEPLGRMGARVETTDGRLPMTVHGQELRGIDYALPVASAQVKSCVLLAGLFAEGETTVVEPAPTRDHTERMLAAAGAHVAVRPTSVTIRPATSLSLGEVEVPGDFSSAAPFVVAATLVPGSEVHVHGVNLNPRRTGLLEILERMGARITVYNRREIGGEPGGDLEVHSAPLVGTSVGPKEVPLAIDELPLFALAAACARGESRLTGAEELRAKETDRIEATVDALRALGVRARARDDGFTVTGVPARFRGGRMTSRGDHRLAMLGAVAGLVSREGVRIDDAEAVAVSFPGFFSMVDALRRASVVVEDERRVASSAMIVAIDGPAGAGKSSVARALADRLGFRYLDTGAMYRALTWLALHEGVPLDDGPALEALADANPVTFGAAGHVEIAGEDVTRRIREPEIDAAVPVVARHPEVREVMRGRQRELGRSGDSVIEGRDIGVIVVPEAELKVWLVADPSVRVRRRHAEREASASTSSPRSCSGATSATPPTRIARRTRSRWTRRA